MSKERGIPKGKIAGGLAALAFTLNVACSADNTSALPGTTETQSSPTVTPRSGPRVIFPTATPGVPLALPTSTPETGATFPPRTPDATTIIPTEVSQTNLQSGETYVTKPGDVIRGDISINGIRWYDDLGETGLVTVVTETGNIRVKADHGAEVRHTNNSYDKLAEAIGQITSQLKKQHGENFRVDVRNYSDQKPQVKYVLWPVDARKQSEPAVFSVREILDLYDGAALVLEGEFVGPSCVSLGRSGDISVVHGKNIKKNQVNFIPLKGDMKIVQRPEDVDEVIQIQIGELRQAGFKGVIKVTEIKYDEDGLMNARSSLTK